MALVQVAKCDVFGGFLDVEQYEIIMRRVGDLEGIPIGIWKPYLSKRAKKRALHFIERAVTEPPRKSVMQPKEISGDDQVEPCQNEESEAGEAPAATEGGAPRSKADAVRATRARRRT